jgi:hypothetical protein
VPRLFALDQNFPQPIIDALSTYLEGEAELVPLGDIDPRLTRDMDDWEVLLSLHHHERPWDGLITTDEGMLRLPRELATLMQTKLTLVVAVEAGHDPLKATGLLLLHLPGVCRLTRPDVPQVWVLRAPGQYEHTEPWDVFKRVAEHQNRDPQDLMTESRLSPADLAWDPLA